jgi:hypothetical protein
VSALAETLLPVAGSSVAQASLNSRQVIQCAHREHEREVQEQQLQSLLSVAGPGVIQPVLRSRQDAQHARREREAQDQFLQQLASQGASHNLELERHAWERAEDLALQREVQDQEPN